MFAYVARLPLLFFHCCFWAARYARGQGNLSISAVEPGLLLWLKAIGMWGVDVSKGRKNAGMVLCMVSHDVLTLGAERMMCRQHT
jgi:hypothetical protein